jgi:hypothetical protein
MTKIATLTRNVGLMRGKMTKRYYPDIKRRRGDWDAKIRFDDGTTDTLPVGHNTYYSFFSGKAYYRDPLDWREGRFPEGPQVALNNAKLQRWVELLKETQRIIIQIDIVNASPPKFIWSSIGAQLTKASEEPYFKANGYLGVYDVDNIKFDLNGGLRFDIIGSYKKVKL